MCLHLFLCIKYGFEKAKKSDVTLFRNHRKWSSRDTNRYQNWYDIKVSYNNLDILVFDKKGKENLIVNFGITTWIDFQ